MAFRFDLRSFTPVAFCFLPKPQKFNGALPENGTTKESVKRGREELERRILEPSPAKKNQNSVVEIFMLKKAKNYSQKRMEKNTSQTSPSSFWMKNKAKLFCEKKSVLRRPHRSWSCTSGVFLAFRHLAEIQLRHPQVEFQKASHSNILKWFACEYWYNKLLDVKWIFFIGKTTLPAFSLNKNHNDIPKKSTPHRSHGLGGHAVAAEVRGPGMSSTTNFGLFLNGIYVLDYMGNKRSKQIKHETQLIYILNKMYMKQIQDITEMIDVFIDSVDRFMLLCWSSSCMIFGWLFQISFHYDYNMSEDLKNDFQQISDGYHVKSTCLEKYNATAGVWDNHLTNCLRQSWDDYWENHLQQFPNGIGWWLVWLLLFVDTIHRIPSNKSQNSQQSHH